MSKYVSRKVTNELIELVEDGVLKWESIARAALSYMSEDDVADMAHINELLPEDEDEEDDDDEDDDGEDEEGDEDK